jgi:ABC-type transporter Mla subunit MlaD
MPRGGRSRRRPTLEDLNEVQQRIYEVLPDELRNEFLAQLPEIASASPQARKKAQLIRDRVSMLEGIVTQLQAHRRQLEQLAKDLENGANSGDVDLREALKPPSIPGVAMRYVRGKRR